MSGLLSNLPAPRVPGLFVTGTDTGVGKTVVACLIADQMRRRTFGVHPRSRVGVLKPFATGCRLERERLVSPDAEELAHAADFDPDIGDLSLVCPIRLRPPVAPAVAFEQSGRGPDIDALARSIERLDRSCERVVVEGVGGVLVPLFEESEAGGRIVTVLDLARAVSYPAVVVCRAGLGTLNHTAMTVRLLRDAGVRVAGLVVNRYDADHADASLETNRVWLEKQTGAPVLATVPGVSAWDVRAIDPALRDAVDTTGFYDIARPGARGKGAAR